MKIKMEQLGNGLDLYVPQKKSAGASCVDLYAATYSPIIIDPGKTKLVPTGFAIEIPLGYEAQIRSRSGFVLKSGIVVANSPGTIDSDYRGEVSVILHNLGSTYFVIERGDRIAQMTIKKVEDFEFVLVNELSETERGDDGFGSTGI